APSSVRTRVEAYAVLINTIAQSEVVQRCQAWRLGDDVVAVLLTKVLTPVFRAWPSDERSRLTRIVLPPDSQQFKADGELPRLTPEDAEYYESWLQTLLDRELQVRHAVEQLDIDTLRLLGLFKSDMGPQSPLEMVDLLGLFTMPMVNDIVNFSLQIIPSVLEATRLRDA